MALDAAGVALLGLLVADAILAPNGDARPIVGLLLGSALALVIGRLLGSVHPGITPGALLVIATMAFVFAGDPWELGRGGGPLEYANASGALFVQLAFAGVIVGVVAPRKVLMVVGFVAAVTFGVLAAEASTAAAVTLALMVVAAPAVFRRTWARPAVAISFVLFLGVLATTVVVGATYREGAREGVVGRELRSTVTERRVVLWHDALRILEEHPAGVGPGNFSAFSPTALADQDARWAHNEFLQIGAELGWVGLIGAILLFTWGFARLLVHPVPDAVVAFGGVALAAFAIHASVDYVGHFMAVPIAAAALLGSAQATPRHPKTR